MALNFKNLKKEYTTLIRGYANIHGYPIAIIANNEVLFNDSQQRSKHFIQLCNMNNTLILFLQTLQVLYIGKDMNKWDY